MIRAVAPHAAPYVAPDAGTAGGGGRPRAGEPAMGEPAIFVCLLAAELEAASSGLGSIAALLPRTQRRTYAAPLARRFRR